MIELIPTILNTSSRIYIPGSKSVTNRALIMAALTPQAVVLDNYLECDDTMAMIDSLESLGIEITKTKKNIVVVGSYKDVDCTTHTLYTRLSGTSMRFLCAFAALLGGKTFLTGQEGLLKRPIADLGHALQRMGCHVEYTCHEGFPPLAVQTPSQLAKETTLSGSVSSQFISALLMISPPLNGFLIQVIGDPISTSYIDITIQMMQQAGVKVINKSYRSYEVPAGQQYNATRISIEGDYSTASYFAAIATVSKSTVRLSNLRQNTVQGDAHFFSILEKMGTNIEWKNGEMILTGYGVRPVEENVSCCPDQAQTLAVLAAFAPGTTILRGVRSLRVKETERVMAVQNELQSMGINTDSPDQDTLIIYGGSPRSADINTYGDHRMAMSFAVAGSVLSGMRIKNPEVVGKTVPNFWKLIQLMGIYQKQI